MLPVTRPLCALLWTWVLFTGTHCFYFNVENELISKDTNIRKCYQEHYLNFNGEIVQVCLDKIPTNSVTLYNIILSSYGDDKKWVEKYKLISKNTMKIMKYFYSFVSNDMLIIIFCFNKVVTKAPYECHYTSTKDLKDVKTDKIKVDFGIFDPLALEDYSLPDLELFDKKFLLLCGLNGRRNSSGGPHPFVICHGSIDGGVNWSHKLLFHLPDMKKHVAYRKVVPKIGGNEIGFRYFDPSVSLTKYIKCAYMKENNFECKEVILAREEEYIWDLTKIRGYYVAILSKGYKPPCSLYYMYNNVYLMPLEVPQSIGDKYDRGNLFPLDSSRVIYNYVNEKTTYTYILKHKGSVKNCTLLYIKREYMNPGFTKEGNKYVCTVNYDDLVVEGNERHLTVSIYNGVRQDIRKCFNMRFDKILEPVNIVHKIDTQYEYSNFKLYTIFIKKQIEHFFLKDNLTLECYLGEDFYLRLKLNYKNSFVIQNDAITTRNVDAVTDLYPNNVIHFKFPYDNAENIINQTIFPEYTKYIKIDSKNYIFKLPEHVQNKIITNLSCPINNISNKFKMKKVIINKGGKDVNILGIDFSNTAGGTDIGSIGGTDIGSSGHGICIYKNKYNNCNKITINKNKIIVNVNYSDSKNDIYLGLICPVNKKNKNVCFNDVYYNKKKTFIRDYLKDNNGFLTIFPKMYINPKSTFNHSPYEESILILTTDFLRHFNEKRSSQRDSFLCKCYMNNVLYDITFAFSPSFAPFSQRASRASSDTLNFPDEIKTLFTTHFTLRLHLSEQQIKQ
ncbi:6-cysteine protein [Plasmodium ovale curtisi]|uniref:6-cysteine protein n=2 Tax=Plasmodium ovale TaxID=36330 RepID=A0A1A8VYQ0_PLAOA|nr:6-cysteine protein [Plasmodium ovale curtisi]